MMATGVTALSLAGLFSNLTALSGGFSDRAALAAFVGAVAFIAGFVVRVTTIRRGRNRDRRSGHVVRAVVFGVAIGWLACVALVYGLQDRLLFSPRPVSGSRLEQIAEDYPLAEDIEITAEDGAVLRGWLLPPRRPASTPSSGSRSTEPVPIVLVFTGQGSEASSYFHLTERLPDMAWAFVNYRGYGASDGSPSDAALFADGTTVFDELTSRSDIDETNAFLLGGSLGTGVATYVAAHRPVRGVVLFSPYDRIGGGVTQDMMPWTPTGWMFRNRFDAAAYAPDATAPVLAVVGGEDRLIRPERSRQLLRHWGGGSRLVVVPDGDHLSIYDDDGVWRTVQGFVRGLTNN